MNSKVKVLQSSNEHFQAVRALQLFWIVALTILAFVAVSIVASTARAQAVENIDSDKIAMKLPTLEDFLAEKGLPTDTLEIDLTREERAEFRTAQKKIRDQISSSTKAVRAALASGNEAGVSAPFFNNYMFALMTQTDDESLRQLGTRREGFFRYYLSSKTVGAARAKLINQITLPKMGSIVENANGKNYHPAVRMNAIAIIGMVNDVEGTRTTPPRPSAAALDYMISLLGNANAEPYLRVGALSGIDRHLRVHTGAGGNQIAGAKLTQIFNLLHNILLDSAPGQDKLAADPDLHYWMKRRAIQGIATLKTPGPNGVFVTTALNILKDNQQETWIRFDALDALGDLRLGSVNKALVKDASADVVEFIASMIGEEGLWLKGQVRKMIYDNILFEDIDLLSSGTKKEDSRGDAGNIGTGGMDGGGTQEVEEEEIPTVDLPTFQLNNSRRRIKTLANTARLALKPADKERGLYSAAATVDEKNFINDAIERLNEFMEESNEGITDLGDMVDEDDDDYVDPNKGATERLSQVCSDASYDLFKRWKKVTGKEIPIEFDPVAQEKERMMKKEKAVKKDDAKSSEVGDKKGDAKDAGADAKDPAKGDGKDAKGGNTAPGNPGSGEENEDPFGEDG